MAGCEGHDRLEPSHDLQARTQFAVSQTPTDWRKGGSVAAQRSYCVDCVTATDREHVMSRRQLSSRDIVTKVRLLPYEPGRVPEGIDRFLTESIAEAADSATRIWVAVWPDDTFAVIFHGSHYAKPSPHQLRCAYRSSFRAGTNFKDWQARNALTMQSRTSKNSTPFK